MSSKLKNCAGFTLIELLVVVAILAILSMMGLALFGKGLSNARDARRREDVDAIAKALEINYVTGSATPYPIPQLNWFSGNAIPKDPSGTDYFWNGANSDGSPKALPASAMAVYTICAQLDNGNGNSSKPDFSVSAIGATATFYCQQNRR